MPGADSSPRLSKIAALVPPSAYSDVWCVTGRVGGQRTCLLSNVCFQPNISSWIYFLEPNRSNPQTNFFGSMGFQEIVLTPRGEREVKMKITYLTETRPSSNSALWVTSLTVLYEPFHMSHIGHTFADDVLSVFEMMDTFGATRPDNILLTNSPSCALTTSLPLNRTFDLIRSLSTQPLRCVPDITELTCYTAVLAGRQTSGMGFLNHVRFEGARSLIHQVLNIQPIQPANGIPRVVFVKHIGKRIILNLESVISSMKELAGATESFTVEVWAWENVGIWRERVSILAHTDVFITQFGTSCMFSPLIPAGSIFIPICYPNQCGNEIQSVQTYQADVRTIPYVPSNISSVVPQYDDTGAMVTYPDGSPNLYNADIWLDWDDFLPTFLRAIRLASFSLEVALRSQATT